MDEEQAEKVSTIVINGQPTGFTGDAADVIRALQDRVNELEAKLGAIRVFTNPCQCPENT